MSIELPDEGTKPELLRDPLFQISYVGYAVVACLLALLVLYLALK